MEGLFNWFWAITPPNISQFGLAEFKLAAIWLGKWPRGPSFVHEKSKNEFLGVCLVPFDRAKFALSVVKRKF